MNKAHVFQNKYNGVQIFVYHQHSKEHAFSMLSAVVNNEKDWDYLGQKIATDSLD